MKSSIASLTGFVSAHIWIILVVWALLSVILVIVSLRMRKTRKNIIRKTAYRCGGMFKEKLLSAEQLSEQSGFDFFKRGENRYAENFIEGIESPYFRLTYFDYSYEEQNSADPNDPSRFSRRFFSCALIDTKDGEIPTFRLEPETLLTRAAEKVAGGKKDIDFEQAPDFSDNYYLYGDNVDVIRNFFNMSVIRSFESHKGLTVYAEGRKILVISPMMGAEKISMFVETAQDISSTLVYEARKRF